MYVFVICTVLKCLSQPDLSYESCNRLRYVFNGIRQVEYIDCMPMNIWLAKGTGKKFDEEE